MASTLAHPRVDACHFWNTRWGHSDNDLSSPNGSSSALWVGFWAWIRWLGPRSPPLFTSCMQLQVQDRFLGAWISGVRLVGVPDWLEAWVARPGATCCPESGIFRGFGSATNGLWAQCTPAHLGLPASDRPALCCMRFWEALSIRMSPSEGLGPVARR